MKTKCFLLAFQILLAILQFPAKAEDCTTIDKKKPNIPMRRYQPKGKFCPHCQIHHLNLLVLPGMEPKTPKWKKCFSSSHADAHGSLQTVLPSSAPETFVFLTSTEGSVIEPETLTVLAKSLGNVSVLLPENSSTERLSQHCRSLSGICHPLENLLPILSQMKSGDLQGRHEIQTGYSRHDFETEAEPLTLHKQLEKLIRELCKRDRSQNRLIELLQHPKNTFLNENERVEDFRFGLSLKDILPLNSKFYDKNRPPKSGNRPTVVYFHVTVLSLDSINEESMTYVADIFLAQSWRDSRLRLPENMSEEYRILDVDWLHDIWRPDCFFKNAKQVTFHEISIPNHYVWLYRDKTLLYMSKLTLVLSCAMKFESYPHDIQVCSMMIESLSHTVQDLIFLWNVTDPLVMNPEIELPQLDISNNYTTDCTVQYSTGNFTCLAVVFTLKRRLGYHLLHTYIPSALIVVMSWISFWIKPEAIPARVTLGVTSLLTLGEMLEARYGLVPKWVSNRLACPSATQNTQSQQSLPPVSYVKAIDIWMSSCSVFVFLSLMEFAIVNNYMGPVSSKAIAGYSEEDLRTAMEDHRTRGELHPPGSKIPENPTCYGKETALCIDRFSRCYSMWDGGRKEHALFPSEGNFFRVLQSTDHQLQIKLLNSISSIFFIFDLKGEKFRRGSMRKSKAKVQEARKKMERIVKNGNVGDLSAIELLHLPAVNKILGSCGRKCGKTLALGTRTAVVALLATMFYAFDSQLVGGLLASWLKWNRGNPKEPCLVPMSDELLKIFRPPSPCSICKDVTEVEKVSKLTTELFEKRYAYTGKPVIVTDGMTNWTAQQFFGFEFFKKVYGERMSEWMDRDCQFFPYKTEFKDLSEVFNMSDERASLAKGTPPWYVGWSNCDDDVNQILRRHYERPYFLPTTAETKRLDWIFMGSKGYGAPMHVDNVEYPSWQAQLKGRKKWTLRPPPECFYDCDSVQVVVEPGEIIVLDTNRWYHSTLIVSEEMSVTIGAEYD